MGRGRYGDIILAEGRGLLWPDAPSPCLVLLLDEPACGASGSEDFVRRVAALATTLLHHDQLLLTLYGVSLAAAPRCAILEAFSDTTLHQALQLDLGRSQQWPMLHLVRAAAEFADAVAFLHKRGFFHGDLGARSALVSDDRQIRLDVMGIGRALCPSQYVRWFSDTLPLRWMAPERIPSDERGVTLCDDAAGDVWMLGVTIWGELSA